MKGKHWTLSVFFGLTYRGQDTYKNSGSHVGTPEANFHRPHQIPVAHLTIHFFYENLTTHDTFTDSESTNEMQVQ